MNLLAYKYDSKLKKNIHNTKQCKLITPDFSWYL